MIAQVLSIVAQAPSTWHSELVQWTVQFAIVAIVAGMMICIFRLLRGPHLVDRALAVDIIAIQLVGLVILLTLSMGSLVLIDGILVLSLLSFAGTVAMAQFIARPHLKRQSSTPKASKS